MRKLVAFAAYSSLMLAAACSDGKGTEPPVNVTCSISISGTSFVNSQKPSFSSNCQNVIITGTGGIFTNPQTFGPDGTIDLSSLVSGGKLTLVGKPSSTPVVLTVAAAIPVSLDLTCDGPTTVTTATQVKCHLKRGGAVRTDITLGNMPTLPDSAASAPRYLVSLTDSNEVTFDVGTIVTNGSPRTIAVSSVGNDGSSVTKILSFNVISVALTAVDSMTTWIPGDGSYEVHFYSKCGFASYNGQVTDQGYLRGTSIGFGGTAQFGGDVIYHNCSHVSAFISSFNTPPQGVVREQWIYQPGRAPVLIGHIQIGGPQP